MPADVHRSDGKGCDRFKAQEERIPNGFAIFDGNGQAIGIRLFSWSARRYPGTQAYILTDDNSLAGAGIAAAPLPASVPSRHCAQAVPWSLRTAVNRRRPWSVSCQCIAVQFPGRGSRPKCRCANGRAARHRK
jgi:hypothetical protein